MRTVTVRCADGQTVEVTPGVLDVSAHTALGGSLCLELAHAIAPHRVAIVADSSFPNPGADDDPVDRATHQGRHAVVVLDDGTLLDIDGVHPAGVIGAWFGPCTYLLRVDENTVDELRHAGPWSRPATQRRLAAGLAPLVTDRYLPDGRAAHRDPRPGAYPFVVVGTSGL